MFKKTIVTSCECTLFLFSHKSTVCTKAFCHMPRMHARTHTHTHASTHTNTHKYTHLLTDKRTLTYIQTHESLSLLGPWEGGEQSATFAWINMALQYLSTFKSNACTSTLGLAETCSCMQRQYQTDLKGGRTLILDVKHNSTGILNACIKTIVLWWDVLWFGSLELSWFVPTRRVWHVCWSSFALSSSIGMRKSL